MKLIINERDGYCESIHIEYTPTEALIINQAMRRYVNDEEVNEEDRKVMEQMLNKIKAEKIIKMREPTLKERESIDEYVKSISKPTGVDFWEEQEPCEDCISRVELLKAIDTWDKFGFDHTGCFAREPKDDFITYVHYDDVVKCIKGMPSVQPKTEWIPCSERLPEEIGTYMTTVDYGKNGLATGQRFYHGALGWEDDCVIAWMPLPTPYDSQKGANE